MEKTEAEIDARLKAIADKKSEVEVKRAELERRENKKVHAFYFDTEEFGSVVGFIKEPALFIKMKAVDMAQSSKTSAAQIIIDCCLMKEESDERIYNEDPLGKYDDIKMGANFAAQGIITYCVDLLKKN